MGNNCRQTFGLILNDIYYFSIKFQVLSSSILFYSMSIDDFGVRAIIKVRSLVDRYADFGGSGGRQRQKQILDGWMENNNIGTINYTKMYVVINLQYENFKEILYNARQAKL